MYKLPVDTGSKSGLTSLGTFADVNYSNFHEAEQ
jgi:hypothetical protein